jgi:hypothetical protein
MISRGLSSILQRRDAKCERPRREGEGDVRGKKKLVDTTKSQGRTDRPMDRKIDISREFTGSDQPGTLPIEVDVEVHAGWGKSWLARISEPRSETDARFGVSREFLSRTGQTLSRAGNGTLHYEITEPGLYEASAVYRSYTTWRVVFEVRADGSVEHVADSVTGNLTETYRRLFVGETHVVETAGVQS